MARLVAGNKLRPPSFVDERELSKWASNVVADATEEQSSITIDKVWISHWKDFKDIVPKCSGTWEFCVKDKHHYSKENCIRAVRMSIDFDGVSQVIPPKFCFTVDSSQKRSSYRKSLKSVKRSPGSKALKLMDDLLFVLEHTD